MHLLSRWKRHVLNLLYLSQDSDECRLDDELVQMVPLSRPETRSDILFNQYLTIAVCYFYSMVLSVLISAKYSGQFQIPNLEVTMDWARWVTRKIEFSGDFFKTC